MRSWRSEQLCCKAEVNTANAQLEVGAAVLQSRGKQRRWMLVFAQLELSTVQLMQVAWLLRSRMSVQIFSSWRSALLEFLVSNYSTQQLEVSTIAQGLKFSITQHSKKRALLYTAGIQPNCQFQRSCMEVSREFLAAVQFFCSLRSAQYSSSLRSTQCFSR